MDEEPLLTIAIPTWNRAPFLKSTLTQLRREMVNVPHGKVELLVSDNCSPDETASTVEQAILSGLSIHYTRNKENIGSDANIAQCFNLAQGKYVLILGDDDLFVDGALEILLHRLSDNDYGMVCLRPYGFESDFRKEYPGGHGKEKTFNDGGKFLAAIGALMTLISSCVINKKLLSSVDARQFCGGNLVQLHLVIRAVLAAKQNLFIDHYLIACKRNNSGGYNFSTVFVKELGQILDSYRPMGLSQKAVHSIELHLIVGYYPFYLLRQRLARSGKRKETFLCFADRFKGRWLFYFWLAPIIRLPLPFAVVWGGIATLLGRLLCGDLRRGIAFAWNHLGRGRHT